MRTNAEINPPFPDGDALLPLDPTPLAESLSSAYRDRLHRWAIVRGEPDQAQRIVCRFRRYADADGHLKLLRQRFPLETFVIIVEPSPRLESPR